MLAEAQLRAISNGDRTAFDSLFRHYQPRYVAYATGLLAGDKEAAEDVVHETFVAIWQQAGRFTGSGSADGWMRRIVRNKSVDWCRRQRETPMTSEVESRYSARTDDSDPFEATANASAAQRLREALAILSVEQREAVWLCYFEELPISQIAAIARCPENTVKTRLFHARKLLRNSDILKSLVLN